MEKQKAPGFYGQRIFEKVEKVLPDGRHIVKKVATETEVDCPCCNYRHVLRQDATGPFVYCTTEQTAMRGATPYAVEECEIANLNPHERTVIITMEFERDGRLGRTSARPAGDDWRQALVQWMQADNIKVSKRRGRY